MNKIELIAEVSEISRLAKSNAEKALGTFMQVIIGHFKGRTFSTHKKEVTISRNTKTGKEALLDLK